MSSRKADPGGQPVKSLRLIVHSAGRDRTAVECWSVQYSAGIGSPRRCGHILINVGVDDFQGLGTGDIIRLLAACMARGDRLQRSGWPTSQPLPKDIVDI